MDGLIPTFQRRGHVPPIENEQMLNSHSTVMPVPDKVIIPLQDIPEDSYQVFVSVGDQVKTGQVIGTIGKTAGALSVHATVSGEVLLWEKCSIRWRSMLFLLKSNLTVWIRVKFTNPLKIRALWILSIF